MKHCALTAKAQLKHSFSCSKPLKVCYYSQNHMTVPCDDHMYSRYFM